MKDTFLAKFYTDGIFHVYNRTNNKEPLFASDENRLYFLKQYAIYIQPYVDTFCWCLLPNHFHFLIQVKDTAAIIQHLTGIDKHFLKPIQKKYLQHQADITQLIELQFKRFFTSYSMAYNKQQNRSGNLFHRPFKRLEIKKDSHFTQAVIYIHANAQKHKICSNFTEYKWSSWPSIISKKYTLLSREKLLDWFGGLQQCIEIHKSQTAYYYATEIAIEEGD